MVEQSPQPERHVIRGIVIAGILIALIVVTVWGTYRLYQPVPIVNRPIAPDKPKQIIAPVVVEQPKPAVQPAALAAQTTRPATPPVAAGPAGPKPVATPTPTPSTPPPAFAPSLVYKADGTIGGKGVFQQYLAGVAVDVTRNILYAAGDGQIRSFDLSDGHLIRSFPCRRQALSVGVDGAGNVLVGEIGRAEKYDPQGPRLAKIGDTKVGEVTSIKASGEDVLVGDATARLIRRFDAAGKEVGQIPSAAVALIPTTEAAPAAAPAAAAGGAGLPGAAPGPRPPAPSLVLPNKVLDFAVDLSGRIIVAHPGRHYVEIYDSAGQRVRQWGRYDERDPRGFCGCCNPINLAAFPLAILNRPGFNGVGIVTVEKSIARVKVYSEEGSLLAVIGPENFDQQNTKMPVAVDGQGRIYVADTKPRVIRRFAPAGQK